MFRTITDPIMLVQRENTQKSMRFGNQRQQQSRKAACKSLVWKHWDSYNNIPTIKNQPNHREIEAHLEVIRQCLISVFIRAKRWIFY